MLFSVAHKPFYRPVGSTVSFVCVLLLRVTMKMEFTKQLLFYLCIFVVQCSGSLYEPRPFVPRHYLGCNQTMLSNEQLDKTNRRLEANNYGINILTNPNFAHHHQEDSLGFRQNMMGYPSVSPQRDREFANPAGVNNNNYPSFVPNREKVPGREDLLGHVLGEENSIRFYLYTRNNPGIGELIGISESMINASEYSHNKTTKILLQDFVEPEEIGDWISQMKLAYLSAQDVNIIVVDFSVFSASKLMVTKLPISGGKRVAEMIQMLKFMGTPFDNFHIIGRSWSVHVAGVAGRILNGQIGRITGLEPTPQIPSINSVIHRMKLSRQDAKFVDVIHVNGQRFFFHGSRFGLGQPNGHVDVYPNIAEKGRGCPGESLSNRRYNFRNCKRGRGVKYFIETVRNPTAHPMCRCYNFEQYKKGGCICRADFAIYNMGEYISNSTIGVFQLAPPANIRFYNMLPAVSYFSENRRFW